MIIYIAHMTPRHNRQAIEARSALGSGQGVSVVCSLDFDASEPQRTARVEKGGYARREDALLDSDCLLLLLPPTDELSDAFSLGVELGRYLQVTPQTGPKLPQIFCLYHPVVPADQINQISKQCHSTPVRLFPGTEAEVLRLVDEIYAIGNVASTPLTRNAIKSGLLAAVDALVPSERYTTAATLTVTISEKDLPILARGEIPQDALIGGHVWEKIFGFDEHTAGLPWNVFKESLQDPKTQAAILADELEAVRKEHFQKKLMPILLKVGSPAMPPLAVVQRHDVFPSTTASDVPGANPGRLHRFSLVCFGAPLLYDPNDLRLVATAFHLTVMAQLFRFTVVKVDMAKLEKVLAMMPFRDRLPEYEGEKREATSNVKVHMLLIDVECRRRGFLDRLPHFARLVFDTFGINPEAVGKSDDENVKAIIEKQKRLSDILFSGRWAEVCDRLCRQLDAGDASLADAIRTLAELKSMNADLLRVSAECYAKLVEKEYGD